MVAPGTRKPAATPKPAPPENTMKSESGGIQKAAAATKKSIWKYFGAAFMEKKDGEYAVSLTRLLSLICFVALMMLWLGFKGPVDPEVVKVLAENNVDVPAALQQAAEVPETLWFTFLALIGGKTLEAVTAIWKGKKGQ